MTDPEEACQTARLRFIGIDWKGVIVSPSWVCNMVLTTAQRTMHPGIDHIKSERRMHTNGGMQAVWWLPAAIADACDEFALYAGTMQRYHLTVTGNHMAACDKTVDLDLNTFQRGVNITHCTACGSFFTHHMPWLQRHTQIQTHILYIHLADMREAELEMRCKPFSLERITGLVKLFDHIAQICPDEVRQHKAIMQTRSPTYQDGRLVRRLPETGNQCPHQQLLRQTHACVWRHFEGAHLKEAKTTSRTIG